MQVWVHTILRIHFSRATGTTWSLQKKTIICVIMSVLLCHYHCIMNTFTGVINAEKNPRLCISTVSQCTQADWLSLFGLYVLYSFIRCQYDRAPTALWVRSWDRDTCEMWWQQFSSVPFLCRNCLRAHTIQTKRLFSSLLICTSPLPSCWCFHVILAFFRSKNCSISRNYFTNN